MSLRTRPGGVWFRQTTASDPQEQAGRIAGAPWSNCRQCRSGNFGLEGRAAADGSSERPLVEIVELAADGHPMREPCHLDVGILEEVGDVVGRALPVDRG